MFFEPYSTSYFHNHIFAFISRMEEIWKIHLVVWICWIQLFLSRKEFLSKKWKIKLVARYNNEMKLKIIQISFLKVKNRKSHSLFCFLFTCISCNSQFSSSQTGGREQKYNIRNYDERLDKRKIKISRIFRSILIKLFSFEQKFIF